MKQIIFNVFIRKVDEYINTLNPVYDEDEIASIDAMKEWVLEEKDILDCDSLRELFYNYEESLSFGDNFYSDHCEDDFDDGMNVQDNSEESHIKRFQKFCSKADDELESYQQIGEYISKHALVSMRTLESIDDPELVVSFQKYYFLLILSGLQKQENDATIANELIAEFKGGDYLEEDKVLVIIREARDKCKLEVETLSVADDLLHNKKELPLNVFLKVKKMLE